MKNKSRGFALPAVLAIMLVCMVLLPALVMWLQQDMKMAVKTQKTSLAFNLAESGVDRGMWKLKSSTSTFAQAAAGTVIAGYNFDTTYSDVAGGTYRIRFSSGPATKQVTIWGEGRDAANNATRSIKMVVQNQTIYSALMAGGNVSWAKGLIIFWGPIISQGNITIADDVVGAIYYPQKYAKGIVTGTATNPRDTNGLTPPNTDNVEWWSQYEGVPDVPVLDFAALRSSAAATGTVNVYGCRSTQGGAGTNNSATAWDTRASCSSSGAHATHFGNPWCHQKSARNLPNNTYVWYWDGDVTLSGASTANQSCGLRGIIIVRGNLTIDTPGEYRYTGPVPTNAWQQHQKFTKTGPHDTSSSAQYPADTGLRSTASTFAFGTTGFGVPGLGTGPYQCTVGIRGFTYVGGNLSILKYLDFNGAVWVNGTVSSTGGTLSTSCGIFYDETLEVPALNVILIRSSWNEVAPSSTPWL